MEIELNCFAWGKKNSSLKKINVPWVGTIKQVKAATVSSHLLPSLKCYRVDEKLYFDDKRLIADNINIPIIQSSIQTTLVDDNEAKTVEELFNPDFLIDSNQVHLIFAWELTDESLLNSGNTNEYFLNVDDVPPSYEASSSNFEHNMSPTTHAANLVIPLLDRGNTVIDANGGDFLKSERKLPLEQPNTDILMQNSAISSASHPLLVEQNEYSAGAITSNNSDNIKKPASSNNSNNKASTILLKNKKAILLVVLILLLIGIILTVYFVLSNNDNGNNGKTSISNNDSSNITNVDLSVTSNTNGWNLNNSRFALSASTFNNAPYWTYKDEGKECFIFWYNRANDTNGKNWALQCSSMDTEWKAFDYNFDSFNKANYYDTLPWAGNWYHKAKISMIQKAS